MKAPCDKINKYLLSLRLISGSEYGDNVGIEKPKGSNDLLVMENKYIHYEEW